MLRRRLNKWTKFCTSQLSNKLSNIIATRRYFIRTKMHNLTKSSWIPLLFFFTCLISFSGASSNNFYGSCPGQCTSLSSDFLSEYIGKTNNNETFCLETINEYISLNQSIRICISNNITFINSTNNDNYTILDYFTLGDKQARYSFNAETYQVGLYKRAECYNAARRYICQHFFPLCDITSDSSSQVYNLCMSSCENYYSSCNSRELIDFRCLVKNNGIDRRYDGVWKQFSSRTSTFMSSTTMCTGNGMSDRSSFSLSILIVVIMVVVLLSVVE